MSGEKTSQEKELYEALIKAHLTSQYAQNLSTRLHQKGFTLLALETFAQYNDNIDNLGLNLTFVEKLALKKILGFNKRMPPSNINVNTDTNSNVIIGDGCYIKVNRKTMNTSTKTSDARINY